MEISELTIRILLLFFPGIICHLIVDALTVHKSRRLDHIILHSFVFSVVSYLAYAGFVALKDIRLNRQDGFHIPPPGNVTFLRALTDKNVEVDYLEVAIVTLLAVGLAFVFSAAMNAHVLHWIAKKLKCSRKFGQPDVWLFSLESPQIRWATVRDVRKRLMFQGYIRAFSDIDAYREILLTQVIVYNERTGEELYRAASIYLSRKKDDVTIEFPSLEGNPR